MIFSNKNNVTANIVNAHSQEQLNLTVPAPVWRLGASFFGSPPPLNGLITKIFETLSWPA